MLQLWAKSVSLPYARHLLSRLQAASGYLQFVYLQFVYLQSFIHCGGRVYVVSCRNVEVQHSIDDIIELVRTHPRENQDLQLDEQSVSSFRAHYSNAMYQVSTFGCQLLGFHYVKLACACINTYIHSCKPKQVV